MCGEINYRIISQTIIADTISKEIIFRIVILILILFRMPFCQQPSSHHTLWNTTGRYFYRHSTPTLFDDFKIYQNTGNDSHHCRPCKKLVKKRRKWNTSNYYTTLVFDCMIEINNTTQLKLCVHNLYLWFSERW